VNFERLFAVILSIYPRAFRERFGNELWTLSEHFKPSSSMEAVRFLSDFFLGGVYERLRTWSWVRFAAGAFWIAGLAISLMYLFWNASTTQLFSQYATSLLTLSDVAVFLLAFALVSRLHRAPNVLEWMPLMWLVTGFVVFLVSFPWADVPTIAAVRSVFGTFLLPMALGLYGVAHLRSSSAWLRVLKLCLIGFAALSVASVVFAEADFILGAQQYRVWGAVRAALILGIILGLWLENKPTRAPAQPLRTN
jgi:hypothetical protein